MNSTEFPAVDGPVERQVRPGSEVVRLVEYLKSGPRNDGVDAAIQRLTAQEAEIDRLRAALKRMDRMHGMMMAQANHGASCYDSECIYEMNSAPLQCARALGPNAVVTGPPPLAGPERTEKCLQ